MSDKTYLVIGAIGRQGSATVNALITNSVSSIVATSRNPESNSAKKLTDVTQVSVLKADLNDPESIRRQFDQRVGRLSSLVHDRLAFHRTGDPSQRGSPR